MSVPDENLTKCTLLVYRSPQALLHNGLPFSLHSSDKACKRERESRYDFESTKCYEAYFFMKGKQNISSLHKTICSLVSLFLLYMKVVAACKVSSVFNHISLSFL